MTYRELQKKLATLTEEQLSCDVTVWLGTTDEYCNRIELRIQDEDDVVDKDHPLIFVPEG